MNKIWYIFINEKQEGPFSFEELQQDLRLTPDTLASKKGWVQWKALRDIPELKALFEEENSQKHPDQEEGESRNQNIPQNELVLDLREEPPYFLWLLVAFVALLYVLFRLYVSP